MPILGIENRTENWRTAQVFAPLFEDADARRSFAAQLLGKPVKSAMSLELFWYPVGDYVKEHPGANGTDDLAQRYANLFPNLREKVAGEFRSLASHYYTTSNKKQLADNIRNTEIDVVLEARHHLFIGEAKREEKFGDSASVLKHQLVRQYVTARILLDLIGKRKTIVPFVVGNDRDTLEKDRQVRCMVDRLGMRRENVLAWEDIQRLTG